MKALELRSMTRDLTSESEFLLVTEDGEIFDVLGAEQKENMLVITVRSRKVKEKKAGTKTKGSGV